MGKWCGCVRSSFKGNGDGQFIETNRSAYPGQFGDVAKVGKQTVADINHGGYQTGCGQDQAGGRARCRVEQTGEKVVVPFDSAQGTTRYRCLIRRVSEVEPKTLATNVKSFVAVFAKLAICAVSTEPL